MGETWPRKIALVDPVSDAGIGGYTHELAQGLTGLGVSVDVYARPEAFALGLGRAYRLWPVLDEALDRRLMAGPADPAVPPSPSATSTLQPYFDLLDRRAATPRAGPAPSRSAVSPRPARRPSISAVASAAMSRHLVGRRYDVVWTQWPELGPLDPTLLEACRARGIVLVHTVHNVLPHERFAGDWAAYRRHYDRVDTLVVHSGQAADALQRTFPTTGGRVIESRHGLYSIYPRRPETRPDVRRRLRLSARQPAILLFGGVRPYKNVEGLLAALGDARCRDAVLLVAGRESGYEDREADSPLGRTARLAGAAGLSDRVRLLPGSFGLPQTAELFEAADIVVLPYHASSGSGVLCLAMTFGKAVVVTPVGGMSEHALQYAGAVICADTSTCAIADGIALAIKRLEPIPVCSALPSALEWSQLGRALLTAIHRPRRRLGGSATWTPA